MKRKKLYQTLAIVVVFLFAGAPPSAMGNRSVFCGESQVCTLWGGKTIDVGTVSISNDEENLYVKYEATGDWYLKEVHLYVLGYEPTERLTPGLAPFKSGDLSYAKDCTFTLPLNQFEEVVYGETALWLQAHASAVKILNNEVVQEETAYACDITAEANPWHGNAMYTVQCCQDVPPPCYEVHG